MASEKQILANQQNALASTGPKTTSGKMAVRLNAVRHGLRTQDALLPDEDPHQLQELCDQIHNELQPHGILQEHLVERIALTMWRLKRVERVEAGVFCFNFHSVLQDRAISDGQGKEDFGPRGIRIGGVNYHVAPSPEKQQEAREQEEHAEMMTRSDVATLGQAFMRGTYTNVRGGDVFSKLSRYEAGLERSLHRSLQALERLQMAREGKS